MKKTITLLLVLAVGFEFMWAEIIEHVNINGLYFNLNTEDYTAEVTYKSYSFDNNSNNPDIYNQDWGITEIDIPSSITYNRITYTIHNIGNHAFQSCHGLTTVTIPNSVTKIGDYAFSQCIQLSYISIPNSVETIGFFAFLNCNNLNTIRIPKNTSKIGVMAFGWCLNLDSISVDPNNLYFQSIDGVRFSKDSTILWQYPYGRKGSYTIPLPVKNIVYGAFHNCKNLNSVTFPNSLIVIGEASFAGCQNLETINIPLNVEEIQGEAFRGCESLSKIYCKAENPPTLGSNVYKECPLLTSIFVPCNTLYSYINSTNWNSYSSIIAYEPQPYTINLQYDAAKGYIFRTGGTNKCDSTCTISAVAKNGYHFVQWSDSVNDNPRSIVITQDTSFTAEFELTNSGQCGEKMFWNYSDGLLSFSGSGDMFNYDNYYNPVPWQLFAQDIKNVKFSNDMTSIGNYACAGITNLEHINIPTSVQTIGNYAFANINNRNIKDLVLPSQITSIGDFAFANNTYIEQIDFGKSVEYIGSNAFQNCSRVTTMTCLAEVTPDVGTDALASISNYAELYVLNSAIRKYQVDANWNRFVLKEMSAEETVITENTVIIVPSENAATITWPVVENANSYTLEIQKDDEVFCTLVFNANGQLTSIAFVPLKNGSRSTSAALMTTSGMQFSVTGLDSGIEYAYTLITKDAQDVVIASYYGNFTTRSLACDIGKISSEQLLKANKVVIEGHIFINCGNKTYTLQGQEVK